jgi:IG-like fold at C-terminal of FixG, putative oxidoreductase
LMLASEPTVSVSATESRWVPVTVQLPYEGATAGSHEINFEIESINSPGRVTEKSVFLVPRQ